MRTLTFAILLACLPAWGAREFLLASSQWADANSANISTALDGSDGLTAVAWVYPYTVGATNANSRDVLAVWHTNSAAVGLTLNSGGVTTPGIVIVGGRRNGGDAFSGVRGSLPISTGVWQHVTATVAWGSAWNLYQNGTNNNGSVIGTSSAGTFTKPNTRQGFDGIGAIVPVSSVFRYPDGLVADAAVWRTALTAAEVASLAAGASPLTVRPQSLVFYAPLVGESATTEVNLIGPALSLSNSPARATSHPRIFNP